MKKAPAIPSPAPHWPFGHCDCAACDPDGEQAKAVLDALLRHFAQRRARQNRVSLVAPQGVPSPRA